VPFKTISPEYRDTVSLLPCATEAIARGSVSAFLAHARRSRNRVSGDLQVWPVSRVSKKATH
jgi:hypothetical protein